MDRSSFWCRSVSSTTKTVFALIFFTGIAQSKEKILWNEWYTITLNHKIKYAIYNEKVTEENNRYHIQMALTKKEEGFLNFETSAAYVAKSKSLTPILFSFVSQYRDSLTSIDGTVKEPGNWSIKVTRGGSSTTPIVRRLENDEILSVSFPLWIHLMETYLKNGQFIGFSALQEDSITDQFKAERGQVVKQEQDAFAKTTGTRLFLVRFQNLDAKWWLNASGPVEKIEISSRGLVTNRTTESGAHKFLGK
jgi:hypothetical protein